jgi:hypothetical protein
MQSTSEEEINYEYLRNVILQFLEHKDRRVGMSMSPMASTDWSFAAQSYPGSVHDTSVHTSGNAAVNRESVV